VPPLALRIRRFKRKAGWSVETRQASNLSGALALAHSDEWPSGNAWSKGHPLLLAQLLVFVLLGLTQLAILIAGRRAQRSEGREKACQLVAAYVDESCPQVQLRNVGVHIWTASGPPFARYLRRRQQLGPPPVRV
jgi:hypothetical protein